MTPRIRRSYLIVSAAAVVGVGLFFGLRGQAHAQGMVRPKGPGTLHFSTKLGSFKLLGNDLEPVTGHLEMTFKGGLLVSGIDHEPKPTGNVRLEYTYGPLKKYAYSGQGKLVIDGTWRSLQWFGSDMDATFVGRGKVRLSGEFDKDLNTGTYWTTDPKKTTAWPANNLMEVPIPGYIPNTNSNEQGMPIPQERKKGG
jgi:hypothetical protein